MVGSMRPEVMRRMPRNVEQVVHDIHRHTVSDSEALIHLAYVQHMWQSKFVVILEDLTRWNCIVFKDATSWE